MAEAYRFTMTITPMTEAEIQAVVDWIRERYGRKPLIHIIGKQPSGTNVHDAPGWDLAPSNRAS